jgi:Peptidase family M23
MIAHGVTRCYGEGDSIVHALRGVSLEIEREKLTAVMGPSGSGKSTLTRTRSHGIDRWPRALVGAVSMIAVLALAGPARAAIPQFTPLSASVLAPPEPVAGTDGRLHIVYEILLQNREAARVDVQSLAVRAPGGPTLLRFAAAQIAAVMTTASSSTNSLAAGEGGTVWLDVALRRGHRVPRTLVNRLGVRATFPGGESRTQTFDGARTPVSRRRALSLSPPLRGGPYLNFNGCCGLSPHRTALVAVDGTLYLGERFAADFIRIDNLGRGAVGDLTRNQSFFTFGEPVYAVADGRVVRTRNNLPENAPLTEPPGSSFTTQTTLGNNVVLKLGGGRYALYAHLKTGSVRVRPGQRVRSGQMLARVGNSGQSGGAHLHFQLSDGPNPVASNGLPFVFGRFTLTGTVTNVDQFLTGTANADVRRLRPASSRRGQLPLHATVVRFPG